MNILTSKYYLPKTGFYSSTDRRQTEIAEEIAFSRWEEEYWKEEAKESQKQIEALEMVMYYHFDLYAIDNFLTYLGNRITIRREIISVRYPIIIVDYTNFFTHWNSIIYKCKNAEGIFKSSGESIEKHYKELIREQEIRTQQ